MVVFDRVVAWLSASMGRGRRGDPLARPLGRATDDAIDAALSARDMGRADLFGSEDTVAPHRQRIAAMLKRRGLSAEQVAARYWPELKLADHACAFCIDKRRCDRWLRGDRPKDSPHRFCPNAMTIDRWRRDAKQRTGAYRDIDLILEQGLDRAREALKHIRAQPGPRSNRH